MKLFYLFVFILCSVNVNSQTITPAVTGEYCPNTDLTFTVSVAGEKSMQFIYYWGVSPVATGPAVYNSSTKTTTIVIKIKFLDVPRTQKLQLVYNDIGATGGDSYFDFKFTHIKSFDGSGGTSANLITNYYPSPIATPKCQKSPVTVNWQKAKYKNLDTDEVFGQVNNYSIQVPQGWAVNGSVAASDIDFKFVSGTSMTLTPDYSTGDGGVVVVRALNTECAANLGVAPGKSIGITRGTPIVPITGDYTICSGSKPYSVNTTGIQGSVTVSNWSVTASDPNAYSYVSNGNSLTLTKVSTTSTFGTITATLQTVCGTVTSTPKIVAIGTPPPENMGEFGSNGLHFAGSTVYDFSVLAPPFIMTGYQWAVTRGTILSGQGTNYISVKTFAEADPPLLTFLVKVRWQNACGWSPYLTRTGYISGGASRIRRPQTDSSLNNLLVPLKRAISISPNPTTGQFTVRAKGAGLIKQIRVLSMNGTVIKIISMSKSPSDRMEINALDLAKGIYMIEITTATTKQLERVVIQ